MPSGEDEVRSSTPESAPDVPSFIPGPWRQPRPASPPPLAVPASRSDALLWLIFAGLGFLIGQLVALIASQVAADVTGNGSSLSAIANMAAPPAWYVGSGLIGLWVGFFLGPWMASRRRGTRRLGKDLGIGFRPIDVAGIAVGIGGQILVVLLYLPFISHLHNFNAPTTKLTGGAHGFSFAVIAIMTVLGAPFFEELFFRGLLFRALLGLFGQTGSATSVRAAGMVSVVAAVVLDGVLFGAAHAELEQLAGLAVFGAILAVVVYKTGRLGMSMVAHGTFNLIAVLAIISTRSGVIH